MLLRAAATVAVLAALVTTSDAPRNRAAASDDLLKAEISALLMNEQDRSVLLVLKPAESAEPSDVPANLVLPMVIGIEEARSIMVAHYKIRVPRPLTHDLMKQMVAEYGGKLVNCAITKMEEGAFHAELRLKRNGKEFVMDCRPSDAIALSLRTGSPIYIRRRVLVEHGVDPSRPDQPRETIKT